MRVEVRGRDGAVTTADGFVDFVAEGIDVSVGVYVVVGKDLHPVARYDYDVELRTSDARLFVGVRQYGPQARARTAWCVSDDGGRSWNVLPRDPPADAVTTQRLRGVAELDAFSG